MTFNPASAGLFLEPSSRARAVRRIQGQDVRSHQIAPIALFLAGLGEHLDRLSQPTLDSPLIQQESAPVANPALGRFLGKLPMPLSDRGIAG